VTSSQTLLAALLEGHTGRMDEAQVLALLGAATPAGLDAILREVDAARLFRSVDDHVLGPRNRTALRDLLVSRIDDLGDEALANLAYGLQAGHTDSADERAIAAVFRARSGTGLTALKNQMNMRTDAHDLEGLVFVDVDDEQVREEILGHIAAEAEGLHIGEWKVLSDIDDTVVCALHDRRYPRGTIYPGVLALFDALDRGPADTPFSLGDLTFVTARPRDALGLIENHTRASLRRAGIATSSVLTGGLINLVTHDLMAAKKVQNIEHYHALFPEYRLLFIGDSGQGDVVVGRGLIEHFAHVVDLVVIHDVVDTPEAERSRLADEGIHVVDTYVGAALRCHERGLISERGLRQVVDETRAALDVIEWSSPAQEDRIRALVERDARAAG